MYSSVKFLHIQDMAQNLPHKEGIYNRDWLSVKKNLLLILEWLMNHCQVRGMSILITSVIRSKIPNVSTSDSHADGRAFDISVRGWTDEQIKDCVRECNTALSKIGATSKSDGIRRAAVFEDDIFDATGKQIKWRHIHFQCARVK